MVTYEQLLELPGAHQNGRPHGVGITCPECGTDKAFAHIIQGQVRFGCSGCFQSAKIAAKLAPHLNGTASGPPPPPADDPPRRQPGDDAEEDQFQQEMLRWKAGIFQVAETLLERDLELRKLDGDALFTALVESLQQLISTVRGYEPPALLPQDEVKTELEAVAQVLVPPAKPKAKAPPPVVEVYEIPELKRVIDEWDRQPWIWDGILGHRSLSLIVGKSETGKSTLIYSLIYAIVTGQKFFGRQCEKGRVVYLAGDPASEIVAGKTFTALGLDDGVTVVAGALVAHPQGMKVLRTIVEQKKPVLVVADTLAATVRIDTDSYGQSYQSQQPLSILAREFGPNLMMSHHSQKSAIDSYSVIDAALGSVGVAAVASSRMATKMYKRNKKKFFTFEMSNLRLGQPIEGEWIVHKMDDGRVEMVDLWATRNLEMDKELILTLLNKRGTLMTKRAIWIDLRPKPKWTAFSEALEALMDAGQVESIASGSKGGGQLYGPPYIVKGNKQN